MISTSSIRKQIIDQFYHMTVGAEYFNEDDIVFTFVEECREYLSLIIRQLDKMSACNYIGLPSFIQHPCAIRNSIDQIRGCIRDSIMPMLNEIRPDAGKFVRISYYFFTIPIIDDMLKKLFCMDLYILGAMKCMSRCGYYYGILSYYTDYAYENALQTVCDFGSWECIAEDDLEALYYHPLLPHPDHFITVKKHAVCTSWVDILKDNIPTSKDPNLVRLCGFLPDQEIPRIIDRVIPNHLPDHRKPDSLIIHDSDFNHEDIYFHRNPC